MLVGLGVVEFFARFLAWMCLWKLAMSSSMSMGLPDFLCGSPLPSPPSSGLAGSLLPLERALFPASTPGPSDVGRGGGGGGGGQEYTGANIGGGGGGGVGCCCFSFSSSAFFARFFASKSAAVNVGFFQVENSPDSPNFLPLLLGEEGVKGRPTRQDPLFFLPEPVPLPLDVSPPELDLSAAFFPDWLLFLLRCWDLERDRALLLVVVPPPPLPDGEPGERRLPLRRDLER